MPDTILIALDGSVAAQNAAHTAIQVAQMENLKVKGLYIVDEALVLDTYADYQNELGQDDGPLSRPKLIERFEAKGSVVLDQLQSSCHQVGVSVDTEMLFGGIPELLLDRAAHTRMLAIGRRGNGHVADTEHLGRHFMHIAHHSHIPLLVGGDVRRTINRLFLVYSGSARADRTLDWTVRLHQELSAAVWVGVINQDDSQEHPERVRKWFEERGLHNYSLINVGAEPTSKIASTFFESQADLIIVRGYRHPEFIDVLLGSQTDEILRLTQLPALLA